MANVTKVREKTKDAVEAGAKKATKAIDKVANKTSEAARDAGDSVKDFGDAIKKKAE